MNDDQKVQAYSILTACVLVGFMMLCVYLQGCAAIKYGTDSDYVSSLDAPYMVGTQINGTKLMSDTGTLPALIDGGPSFIADFGLLPYHLFLYWQRDDTRIPKYGPGTED